MYAFMAEEFVHARFGDDGEANVVDDCLKGRGWRETVPVGRRLAQGRGEREALRRPQQGLRPFDTAWIWRALGMEAHR